MTQKQLPERFDGIEVVGFGPPVTEEGNFIIEAGSFDVREGNTATWLCRQTGRRFYTHLSKLAFVIATEEKIDDDITI